MSAELGQTSNPTDLALDDGVAIVRLVEHGATGPLLTLPDAALARLAALARALRARTDLRAVVLTGSERVFSAGIDLGALAALGPREAPAPTGDGAASHPSLLELRERLRLGPELCAAWQSIEAPTIAAIEGPCVGGALALALACDWRIAGAGAQLKLPEVPLGMNMSWGALPRLTALVGPARAKRLAIFGEGLDAATAVAWGLVDEVAAAGGALAAAQRWAARIAALPPLPVRMTKETVNAASGALAAAVSHMDRDQFLLTFGSADLREGVSAFLGKRPPRFTGD